MCKVVERERQKNVLRTLIFICNTQRMQPVIKFSFNNAFVCSNRGFNNSTYVVTVTTLSFTISPAPTNVYLLVLLLSAFTFINIPSFLVSHLTALHKDAIHFIHLTCYSLVYCFIIKQYASLQ